MTKKRLLIAAGCVVAGLLAALGFFYSQGTANASLSMTELNIDKMSCGSCVANITTALQQLDGVASVEINVTSGRGKVAYDADKVAAPRIASVVTEAGYPARVTQQLTAEQYSALQNESAKLAEIYVAKIGDRLLSRSEFNALVAQRLNSAEQQGRPQLPSQVVQQTWENLKQRYMLLGEAEKNGVVVQDGEVELRIKQLRDKQPNFDREIALTYGSADDFARQLKEDMIINRNIEEHVLAGIKDPRQRQQRYNGWYRELITASPVVIYDDALKQTLGSSAKGGCGSGCCG